MPDEKSFTFNLPENSEKGKNDIIAEMAKENSLDWRHLRANGIYQPSDMLYDTKFYRTRRIDPYYQVEGGTEYLFFTKPDLNLIEGGVLVRSSYNNSSMYGKAMSTTDGGPATVPFFIDLYRRNYAQTFADLCRSANSVGSVKTDQCPFVRLLSNRRVSNMDVPDIITNEIETSQNMFGTRIFYPTSSMKSDEDTEFSIEFEDTQYLEVYNFFKAYDMYRQLKYLGIMGPKPDYVRYKILHDHMSIYKFIVDNDGETLLYWAKATGVYPKTISRSAFSEIQDKGGMKITVSFKLSGWFEDLEPNILTDFNQLIASWVGGSVSAATPKVKESLLWDDELQAVSGENVDYFYVTRRKANTGGMVADKKVRYMLKAGKF